MDRDHDPEGQVAAVRLGHPDVDRYLEFVAARARRNTLLAVGFDLKVFFTVVTKDPAAVTTADVYAFIAAQRAPRHGPRVVRLEDGGPGLASRTIQTSALQRVRPVRLPRRPRRRRRDGEPGALRAGHPPPMCRPCSPRWRADPHATDVAAGGGPYEVDVFFAALRTHRDRAMTLAMLLGGLRRCEVLGLSLEDVHPGLRRVFIADGKGGAQRYVSIAPRFFIELAAYLEQERPEDAATDRVFVALKRPQRGGPLTADGLDEIVKNACHRAGLRKLTCHQLRHTCFTRLRQAGMALEAIQALAGHRCIESTRMYLHLTNDWLAQQYSTAMNAIDNHIYRNDHDSDALATIMDLPEMR